RERRARDERVERLHDAVLIGAEERRAQPRVKLVRASERLVKAARLAPWAPGKERLLEPPRLGDGLLPRDREVLRAEERPGVVDEEGQGRAHGAERARDEGVVRR